MSLSNLDERGLQHNWSSSLTRYNWIRLSPSVQDSSLLLLTNLARVSVPVWLIILSDQLRIIGLVSFYLTNYLILHKPLKKRNFLLLFGISPNFLVGSHALLTRSLLSLKKNVQLACVKFTASIHSEPGSNSSGFFRKKITKKTVCLETDLNR